MARPSFLAMKPAGHEPYEAGRVWERMDWTGTQQSLEAFVHEYVLRLEDYIEDDAADAYVETAKHPQPAGKIIERSISKGAKSVTVTATSVRRNLPD